jgi:hypothetical protein
MTLRVAQPALRAIDSLTRRRFAPVAASLSVAAATRTQRALAQLLAPALPASELQQWEADLILQAKTLRRAAAALRGRRPSMAVTDPACASPMPDTLAHKRRMAGETAAFQLPTTPDASPMAGEAAAFQPPTTSDASPMAGEAAAFQPPTTPDASPMAGETAAFQPPTTPDARADGAVETVTRRKARRTLPEFPLGAAAESPADSFLGPLASESSPGQLSPSLTPMSAASSTRAEDSE